MVIYGQVTINGQHRSVGGGGGGGGRPRIFTANRSPSQAPREEETDKSKQAQTEQTFEKH